MDQRELTFKCVELVSKKYDCMVVVDSQLRNQFLVDSLEKYRVTLGKQILLDCSDSERESRLLARGLSNDEIAQMIHWARYLREESVQEKVSIVDTTSVSESDVVVSVLESIVEMGGI